MIDDEWVRRIAAAYGRRASALVRKIDGLQVRTDAGRVIHRPDDDDAVEAEKISLGIQIIKEAAYCRRMEGKETKPIDTSCQSFFRRLLRHHKVDVEYLLSMLPHQGRPLIHDRGDTPAQYLNILGRHQALRPDVHDGRMGSMPSFVMEAWTPYTVTVVLTDRVILRGGRPLSKGAASLSLLGDALPSTMRTSLVGRPLNEIVRHPAFQGSGHMITSVGSGSKTSTVYLTSVPDAVGGRR